MPLLIECSCGKKLKVRDEFAGKKMKCPGCGGIVVAAPMVTAVKEPPRVLPVGTDDEDEKSTAVSAASPPARASKKKPPPTPAAADDDEVNDEDAEKAIAKPVPYWVFPGTRSSEVMAVAREEIWFATLKGDAIEAATRKLDHGAKPAEAFGAGTFYIPWVSITSIYCNRKRSGFTIAYTNNGEAVTKLVSAGGRERDEIFEAIEDNLYPGWNRAVVKHTAVTATFMPILAVVITFVVTIGVAVLSLFIGGDWEGRGRGAALAALFNMLDWMGPLGSCGVGTLVGCCMVLWMLVRMMNPPVEVTLKPLPPDQRVDDDEND